MHGFVQLLRSLPRTLTARAAAGVFEDARSKPLPDYEGLHRAGVMAQTGSEPRPAAPQLAQR